MNMLIVIHNLYKLRLQYSAKILKTLISFLKWLIFFIIFIISYNLSSYVNHFSCYKQLYQSRGSKLDRWSVHCLLVIWVTSCKFKWHYFKNGYQPQKILKWIKNDFFLEWIVYLSHFLYLFLLTIDLLKYT